MDQKKIGSFIAARRKDNGMTESQLAEKLGITDKAISKWETGKSMPDLSLFNPLCKDFTLDDSQWAVCSCPLAVLRYFITSGKL